MKTLLIEGIPGGVTNAILEEQLAEFGPLKRCFAVRKKGQNDHGKVVKGYAEFALPEDADECLRRTQGHLGFEVDGRAVSLSLTLVEDRNTETNNNNNEEAQKRHEQSRYDEKAARRKKARLIVRNLSFVASENELRNHFEEIGPVQEVVILKRADGRRVGCAFVNFEKLKDAAKAIKKLNGSKLKNRQIAVDWAVGKKEYQGNKPEKEEVKEEIEELETADIKQEIKEEEISEDEENFASDDDEEDSVASSDDDEEDSVASSDDREESSKAAKWHNLKTGHDINENLTVFLRNLSYDTSEDDLKQAMVEQFGEVFFARLVIDKATEHPRGTAFVKFRNADSVAKCLEQSGNTDSGLWLDGRQIHALKAINKEQADEEVKKKKEKEKKDSRNLHLAVEGLVRKGTLAAQGVSEADMASRLQIEKWKRARLKDLNMFVSPHRLCIRNLPPRLTDKGLRKLVLSHVKDAKNVKLTEVKIMRDLNKGEAPSKGYAFVTFTEHDHALATLRSLNNNPAVFGKDARPIVEFSIENRRAVNARQKRLEKSRANNPTLATPSGPSALTKFKRKKTKDRIEDPPDFVGSLNNPKQRNLPSHVGEKIRHEKRISRKDLRKEEKLRKDPKLRRKRKMQVEQQQQPEKEEPKKKKTKKVKNNKEAKEERDFSDIVAKYKNKIAQSENSVQLRQKWFDD